MQNLNLICILIVLIQLGTSLATPHESRHGEYVSRGTFPLAKKRAVAATTESTADLLTRLKLMAYEEKLKEKELKKQAKVDKAKAKAEKDQAMWTAYINSLNAAGNSSAAAAAPLPIPLPLPAPLLYPGFPIAPAANVPGAVPIMPMPMVPAIGLWKKQMFLSQLYGAAAAQAQAQAQLAAAQAGTTTEPTTIQDTIVQLDKKDALAVTKEKVISQITKRYARYLSKKHGDEDEKKRKHGKKHEDEDQEDDDDYSDEDDGLSGASNRDTDDEMPLSSLSGASNKFGTAPGGNSPVAQAGCSGSHIHVCSGTTFYLNSPENIKSAAASGTLPEDLKPDDDEDTDKALRKYKSYSEWKKSWRNDDDEDEDSHFKKSKKRGGHRSRKHKKHGHKHEDDKKSNEDEQDQEDNEKSVEEEPTVDQNEKDAEKDEKKA